MSTSLFISKNPDELQELPRWCREHNWDLEAKSLISFRPLAFSVQQPFDIIFISSIRAYDHLIARYPAFRGADFAVIGEATAKKMNVENSQIKYLVENSGETQFEPLKFKDFVKKMRVLFPVSSISNNTYSNLIPQDQKEVVQVYETLSSPASIQDKDCYVFTSPSNVRSFFELNTIPGKANIIAWGDATKNSLLRLHINPFKTLIKSTEKELVETISLF